MRVNVNRYKHPTDAFSMEKQLLAPLKDPVMDFAIANYKNTKAVLSGGSSTGGTSKKVFSLEISKKKMDNVQ